MICPNCKREVPDTAKACGYCGHWLADEGPDTVQVPAGAATVALPEGKGRPPWPWIGVGLGVVALVAAVGVLAFLAGRGSGGVEGEATPAAASEAAPAPAAEGGLQAGAAIYDDFDDPAFDGDYDKSRWRVAEESAGDFFQEGGILVVTHQAQPESGTRLVAREVDFVPLEAPTAFEAKLRLEPEQHLGNVQLGLAAEMAGGQDWWWTECHVVEDWLNCEADLGFQPEGIPVRPGTWHTVRIEVDPATMTFGYFLDGREEGTFVPPNAEALKSASFALKIGVWQDERQGGVVGFVDDVRIE